MLIVKEMFQKQKNEDENILQTKDCNDIGLNIWTDEDQKAFELGFGSSLDPNYQSMIANDDYYNMGIAQ